MFEKISFIKPDIPFDKNKILRSDVQKKVCFIRNATISKA
mgnify:CR=1 FL=1